MFKTILIDDERAALKVLECMLGEYGAFDIVGQFTDVTKALLKLKEEQDIQVIFLDIEMPKIKGLDAAKKIKDINSNAKIIFITAHNQYAVEAFEVNALDYIMKPVSKKRFDKTVEKIINSLSVTFQHKEQLNAIKIQCFGSFQMFYGKNEEMIKWRTAKAQELMAYLVHNKGKYVHKYNIIENLWPEKEEEQATKLLHTSIYYIRKILKDVGLDKRLSYSKDMYKFDMEGIYCDLNEFENTIKAYPKINSENILMLEKAAVLSETDYFEQNDFSWAQNEKERLNFIYIDLLKRISEYYIATKQYNKATICLLKILEKNPYYEEIHQKLLRVYAHMDDWISFSTHYENLIYMFRRELGIEILDTTKELYEALYQRKSHTQ